MKLKTLNDLVIRRPYGNFNDYVQVEELKAEAIKWFHKSQCINSEPVDKCDCAAEFMLAFFNITSEDLK